MVVAAEHGVAHPNVMLLHGAVVHQMLHSGVTVATTATNTGIGGAILLIAITNMLPLVSSQALIQSTDRYFAAGFGNLDLHNNRYWKHQMINDFYVADRCGTHDAVHSDT